MAYSLPDGVGWRSAITVAMPGVHSMPVFRLAAFALAAAAIFAPDARADYFESVAAPGMCLHAATGGVSIQPCDGSPAQDIVVVQTQSGLRLLAGIGCLKMAGEGQMLQVLQCIEGRDPAGTEFSFGQDGSIKGDGLCIDVKGGKRNAGARVIGFRCNGQSNQRWSATKTGTTAADNVNDFEKDMRPGQLSPRSAQGMCLSANGGGAIELQPCDSATELLLAPGAPLTMIRTQDMKCLDPHGAQGQQLRIVPCTERGDPINWGLTTSGLLRTQQGLCADVEGNRRNPGTRVILFKCSGNDNQRFLFLERFRQK